MNDFQVGPFYWTHSKYLKSNLNEFLKFSPVSGPSVGSAGINFINLTNWWWSRCWDLDSWWWAQSNWWWNWCHWLLLIELCLIVWILEIFMLYREWHRWLGQLLLHEMKMIRVKIAFISFQNALGWFTNYESQSMAKSLWLMRLRHFANYSYVSCFEARQHVDLHAFDNLVIPYMVKSVNIGPNIVHLGLVVVLPGDA